MTTDTRSGFTFAEVLIASATGMTIVAAVLSLYLFLSGEGRALRHQVEFNNKAREFVTKAADFFYVDQSILDLYSADGKPIVYEITEDSVLYYKTRITGDQLNGYHIVNYHRVDRVVGNWPRTGDDSNIQAWLIPFAVSGAALAGGGGAFLYRKKKKNLKKENDS